MNLQTEERQRKVAEAFQTYEEGTNDGESASYEVLLLEKLKPANPKDQCPGLAPQNKFH